MGASRLLVALNFAGILLMGAGPATAKTPVIFSTDVGNEIDDQWAIVYLLTNPAFEVLGIISAHAPTVPDPSAQSTYRVLVSVVEERMRMAVHPPLYEGSSRPLENAASPRPNAGVDFLVASSRTFSGDNRLNVLTVERRDRRGVGDPARSHDCRPDSRGGDGIQRLAGRRR